MSCSRLGSGEPIPISGALPPDALFEVLLRIPAKDLCRLRAVCRFWLALTSDPHFAAAHKSRHAEPLFVVTFRDGDVRGVSIVNLSGEVLRRVPVTSDGISLFPAHLDRICVTRDCKAALGAWVINPATGAVLSLPGRRPEELLDTCSEETINWGNGNDNAVIHNCARVTYTVGQVAATGQYKVLRISDPHRSEPLLCDIITLDGSNVGRWRRKPNPPGRLMWSMNNTESLAFNGVIYLLYDDAMEPDTASIGSFNLETEKWMPKLRGPEPLRSSDDSLFGRTLTLASLNGCLVIVEDVPGAPSDLWFLEANLWVRKYRLTPPHFDDYIHPFLILDNGRILCKTAFQMILSYDPMTGTSSRMQQMEIADTISISVYTGGLLI